MAKLAIEEMVHIVQEIIEKHTHLVATGETHYYEGDIHVEYSDCLTDEQIAEIAGEEDMTEAVYEVLADYAQDCQMQAQDEVLNTIYDNWDEEQYGLYEDNAENIRDYVIDFVHFNFPYDHYLKTEVLVNVVVDTGDGNYDYALNNLFDDEEEIHGNSSLLWLAEQQGYNEEELVAAVNEKFSESKFLKSIVQECLNVTSGMNALTFFVKMTLEEFIEFKDSEARLLLSKDVNCGLVDYWNGAGSVLEIELDKEVEIPSKYIKAHVDGCRGYGVDSIYGMEEDFWKGGAVKLAK